MPKGNKGGQKGKERAQTRSSPRKKDQPQEEERESVSETNLVNLLSEVGDNVFPPSQQTSKFTETQDELIASYFEDLPAFYDMSNPDYKNKVKKNVLPIEFADEMGLARECMFYWSSIYFRTKRHIFCHSCFTTCHWHPHFSINSQEI